MQRKFLIAALATIALWSVKPAQACLHVPADPIHCINNGVPVTGFSDFFNDNLFAPPGLGPGDANCPFCNPPNQILEFGGEAGGPMIKDRLWFWGSGNRGRVPQGPLFDRSPGNTELINYAGRLSGQATASNEANPFFHFGDKLKDGRQNDGPPRTTWNSSNPAITPVGPTGGAGPWNIPGNIFTNPDFGGSPAYYDFGAIEEIQVATGGADAGQLTGGIGINIVTKRGSNEIHGSARGFFTNEALQGETRFFPSGAATPPGAPAPLSPPAIGAIDFPLNALPAAAGPGGINVLPQNGGGFNFSFVDPASLNPATTTVGGPVQLFDDIPPTNPFFRFIEELARRGGVSGSAAATPKPPADAPASSPFVRWIEELSRRGITAEPGTAPLKPFGATAGGRTFVLPHVVEVSGRIDQVQNTFDTAFFTSYSAGLAAAAFPGEAAKVDVFLFDQTTGRPMTNGANEQVCNPCTLPLGDTATPRKQTVRMERLVSRGGGFPDRTVLGFAIAVIGADPNAVNMQGFVTNAHTSAFDLSVFGFDPQPTVRTGTTP